MTNQWAVIVIVAIIGAVAFVVINNWYGNDITNLKPKMPSISPSPAGGTYSSPPLSTRK